MQRVDPQFFKAFKNCVFWSVADQSTHFRVVTFSKEEKVLVLLGLLVNENLGFFDFRTGSVNNGDVMIFEALEDLPGDSVRSDDDDVRCS